MDMKPIFAILFCVIIVIILEIVELSKDNTCKVESSNDGAVASTSDSGGAAASTSGEATASTSGGATAPTSGGAAASSSGGATAPTSGGAAASTPVDGGLIFRDPDTVIIGHDGGWPPYCTQKYVTDPDAPEFSKLVPDGFIYEVLKEACDRGNLKCEFPITGKWHQCWAGGEAPEGQPRNDRQDNAGTGLISGQYDMCSCWVMTQARMARVQFAINKERGYTKQTLAGLMTLSSKENNAAEWDRLKLTWPSSLDTCNGATMKMLPDGRWFDDCRVDVAEDITSADQCDKACPGGKVKIGYVEGWAMKTESFDWAINSYTQNPFNNLQKDRIIWVDEHTHEGKTVTHTDYHHIARALETGEIDMAYTFSDAILAMQGDKCAACDNPDIWEGGVKWHQTNIRFAAGGVGTFMKYGQTKLAERLNVGVDILLDDKAWYCPKCKEYWSSEADCNATCIGCGDDAPAGGINYCKS